MSSILVEEVGIDIVLAALSTPPAGDTDDGMMVADHDNHDESRADVEMQQRMDEDEASSRSNGGDCEMPESQAPTETVVIAPFPEITGTECQMPANNPIVATILAEQVSVASMHIQSALAAPLPDDGDTTDNATPRVHLQPSSSSAAPISSPSLSDYIVSPDVDVVVDATAAAAALHDQPPTSEPTSYAAASTIIVDDAHFADNRLIELSRHSWGVRDANYLRGCLWSPDGTCILTPVNRDGMHVLELPTDLYTADAVSASRPLDVLSSAVHVPEMGTVYDYCWYPFMHSTEPATCCWLSTQQHGPIQMWDAFDGRLRCSYRGYDAVDEVEAAVSVCFSADATSVIGGYRKSVKIFRTALPGRDFTQFPLRTPASCLAVHATQPDLLAVGAWTGAVTVHDTRSPRLDVLERLSRRRAGGVTMMRFTPDGRRLWVGARKDGVLACWDVRMPVEPVLVFKREVRTNQRVQFDMSAGGRWLVSGDTTGVVRVWDLEGTAAEAEDAVDGLREQQFGVHHDCCNGVALHPTRPVLATCSGQHHFGLERDDDDEEGGAVPTRENSLIFWWYGRNVEE